MADRCGCSLERGLCKLVGIDMFRNKRNYWRDFSYNVKPDAKLESNLSRSITGSLSDPNAVYIPNDFNCEAGWGEWIETLLNFQKMVKESCQLWDKIIVENEKAIP